MGVLAIEQKNIGADHKGQQGHGAKHALHFDAEDLRAANEIDKVFTAGDRSPFPNAQKTGGLETARHRFK
jgi:hypothetical protein